MDYDEKVAWLRQYHANWLEMDRLLDEMAGWESFAYRVTTVFSHVPGGGVESDRIGRAVAEMDALRQSFAAKLEERGQLRQKIESALDTLPEERLGLLLRYRYVGGLTFEQIAEKMHYSDKQIGRLHRQAVDALQVPG